MLAVSALAAVVTFAAMTGVMDSADRIVAKRRAKAISIPKRHGR